MRLLSALQPPFRPLGTCWGGKIANQPRSGSIQPLRAVHVESWIAASLDK